MPLTGLSVEKLGKRYGYHRALWGVDLSVRAGAMCAVLGPTGAGKSTLMGILSTLIRPTSGTVHYQRAPGETLTPAQLRQQIGVLAHDSFVYSGLTGLENLLLYARLYQLEDGAERASRWLDKVALDERARTALAGTYSRGMLQRLALARALLHDPQLLLLDEPFTGLDRAGTAALADTLAESRRAGRIIVVVTHDLEAIAEMIDQVALLRGGKLVHETTGAFTYSQLKDLYHHHTE